MLYEIYTDGYLVGQLYGESASDAVAKAKIIWKLTGIVKAFVL